MTKRPMLGFALLSCSIALAQQPAEWRPNIAEDNKTATWEATKSFIDHTLAATRPWTIRLASREIDFSRIDPLEITVKPAQQTWAIRVSGTSGQTIGNEVASSYEGKSPNDQDDPAAVLQMIRELGLTVPCLTHPPKGFSCIASEASVTDTEFLVSDLDAAKRIARAMMHEALVCGGKKAVSPF